MISDFESRFREYSFHLHDSLNHGNLGPTAACKRQGSAKMLLTWASGDSEANVGRGALILPSPSTVVPAPLKKNVDAAMNLALHLFNQLENFITKNLCYPFLLKLPHERAWIVPATRWIYTNAKLADRYKHSNANWIWDYTNGEIHEANWVQDFYGYNPAKAQDEREKVLKRLNAANNDQYHYRRMKLASWAYNSFMVLIFALTGANLSTFIDFPWSDDITLEPTRQGFRAFKGRAGKIVSYEIKAKFIPYFRRYLKLRSFLLRGQEFSFLFFKIKNGKPEKVSGDFIDVYFQMAHTVLGLDLEPISATEFRKYKANWSANNLSIDEGAKLAQNSAQVFSERYTGGNRQIQAIDITNHFSRLANQTKANEKKLIPIPAGGCTEYGSPIENEVGIQPSCSTQICCFFCEHYLIHRNKEDIWKILSIRHVCSDLTQAHQLGDEDTIALVMTAIDSILAEFMKSPETEKIIRQCRSLVSNGYLSEYWQEYFNLLLRLQVLE
ncbi:hypothetical protein [Pseudomonas sp. NA-150]|uniref:hypothetical protein n=1 Tax=Pseudomonas sp. NA-150 TaxID=3367525 RepID=UPI0037CCB260